MERRVGELGEKGLVEKGLVENHGRAQQVGMG